MRQATDDKRGDVSNVEVPRGVSPVACRMSRKPLRLCASALKKLVGITPDYTCGDRIIAWGVFFYSFVFLFGLCFLGVVLWNTVSPWPIARWSRYFVFLYFIVPAIVSSISTVWFGTGGVLGLRRLFRDLAARKEIDETDDGRVE